MAQKTIWAVFEISSSDQDSYSSILSATIPLGAMFGAISAGKLLDSVSRKNSFFITDTLGVVAVLLS
jgi:predicted MFS family arabinose efflux permease